MILCINVCIIDFFQKISLLLFLKKCMYDVCVYECMYVCRYVGDVEKHEGL
jgi:hypothetical protein